MSFASTALCKAHGFFENRRCFWQGNRARLLLFVLPILPRDTAGVIEFCKNLSAHPYSISTFGLGVGRLSRRLPTKVRSGTKTAAWSIFRNIVSTIGGDPATPTVSRSTASSRTASSTSASLLMRAAARSRALSMKFRPPRVSVSACHEKKTVVAIRILTRVASVPQASQCGLLGRFAGPKLRESPDFIGAG